MPSRTSTEWCSRTLNWWCNPAAAASALQSQAGDLAETAGHFRI